MSHRLCDTMSSMVTTLRHISFLRFWNSAQKWNRSKQMRSIKMIVMMMLTRSQRAYLVSTLQKKYGLFHGS